jgi:dienelactone hydrolase
MLQTKKMEYHDGNALLEGYCAYDDKITGRRPAILVAHDWSGCNEFACQKAEKLAELGYVGFALDIFGKGVKGNTKEEKAALIKPWMENRSALVQRVLSALNMVKTLKEVDPTRLGAIGFCFGGLCVLDLARAGASVQGVVSFHGLLHPPQNLMAPVIQAKVLALHGHDDPMGSPAVVVEFEREMTAAKADWQVHVYGNTMHAFTNPLANDPGFGTVYHAVADSRSWIMMKNFFIEIFS